MSRTLWPYRACDPGFSHWYDYSDLFYQGGHQLILTGFLTKTKKLLEIVCHNCSKIKADTSDPKFQDALRIRDPKRRFDIIWRLSKDVNICEADPMPEDEDPFSKEASKPHKGHGGCGNAQPTIRKEGLSLVGTWKPNKANMMDDDVDMPQPEKRTITPAMAYNIFRGISPEDVRIMGLSNDYARPEWMILTVLIGWYPDEAF